MQIALAFVGGLLLMVVAAVLFTNGIESLAGRLGMGHAMTGSVMAAVGTAMPETIVPIVALIAGGAEADQTAVGAILGAPLMLSTLALALIGGVSLALGRPWLRVQARAARRPLAAFSLSFALLILATFLPRPARWAVAALLLLLYADFVRRTRRADEPVEGEPAELLLTRALRGWEPGGAWRSLPSLLQLLLGLGGLALASELFIFGLHRIAALAQISPLVLALLLVPIATELPEISAGTLWVRRDRDMLALGNVAGSLALQASIGGSVGLCFTTWDLSRPGYLSAGLTLGAALLALAAVRSRGLDARLVTLVGVCFYVAYALLVLVARV